MHLNLEWEKWCGKSTRLRRTCGFGFWPAVCLDSTVLYDVLPIFSRRRKMMMFGINLWREKIVVVVSIHSRIYIRRT